MRSIKPCGPANGKDTPISLIWCTTPTAARRADSIGRRNTLISEVFNDGNGGLEQEDQ